MYAGIDLGSTNIKVALYDENLTLIDRQSRPVVYIRDNGFVEFDALKYAEDLAGLLADMTKANGIKQLKEMAFTGQAESLVVLDGEGKPLMNAISWMDERSTEECEELAKQFDAATCEAVTGQMAVLPTWPATKILWLKHHRPEIYEAAATYMLLKDYVVYYLTGVKKADMSIATFSFYFDIYNKHYWGEMLNAIGVSERQLPELCEPCSVAGTLKDELAEDMGIACGTKVNVGTLDHFAGMIGTGNIAPGGITLSTGTVMALAAMCGVPAPRSCGIAMHYGFLPDTHVMLPVAESGGVSLEWFRRSCMGTTDYDTMNAELLKRQPNELLFLPYLVGTNAPEFDTDATGVFWGLRQEHDAIDMAGAVMEGVAFVLRKNCDYIAKNGVKPTSIIATGGGAKSPVWCQLQADITGLQVRIPAEKEAACLGAAMIAAVSDGRWSGYEAAAIDCVSMLHQYNPNPTARSERKYRRFCALYEAGLVIGRMN
jgi:sugar (pentulose or hexulose) kinase